MGFFARIDRHAELFRRMAEATGTDLGKAVAERRLNAHRIPAAVWSCTACNHVEECESWLATHESGAPPSFCRNRDLLTQLGT